MRALQSNADEVLNSAMEIDGSATKAASKVRKSTGRIQKRRRTKGSSQTVFPVGEKDRKVIRHRKGRR